MTSARQQQQVRARRPDGVAVDAVASVVAVRMVIAALCVPAALYAMVMLYRHSMRITLWGPFLQNAPQVQIVRYSTPWLLAAAGLALLAGLLMVAAIADAVRWRRLRKAARRRRT